MQTRIIDDVFSCLWDSSTPSTFVGICPAFDRKRQRQSGDDDTAVRSPGSFELHHRQGRDSRRLNGRVVYRNRHTAGYHQEDNGTHRGQCEH